MGIHSHRNNDLSGSLLREEREGAHVVHSAMAKEMKGLCFLFSETGTEGSWWAMQGDGFVEEDGH
ncbi:hypothetical protein [Occallatibacter riparius]|uniref:Uncharacterized protein n=1 Tax=Occallatibacter riparius TaxID=1002689 RepID=A0A9J7BR47_9BACT|nr:hypothetical protein [Occallatibacter riparius]UWZ85152.1 hypothetical protein MOP44_04215 [Occallatibacter riparius]